MGVDLARIKEIYIDREIGTVDEHKFFSVLLPLVKVDGELNILFEIRAMDLERQPGEICFPGGGIEGDETPEECAIRETCEELFIGEDEIKVIGQSDTVHTTANFSMYVFIGELVIPGDVNELRVNGDEVDSIFLVPLSHFLENNPEIHNMVMTPQVEETFPYDKLNYVDGYKWRRGYARIPIYEYEGKYIWGLTARIVENFTNTIALNEDEIR